MVRKGGGSTQRTAHPTTTYHGFSNDMPPPSTIAAQIVHNANVLTKRQDAASKVSFGELVKEFLQHPSTDEPDAQLVALICVIVEAGLEGLFKDDPFAQDQQRQQGNDSIAALTLIIQKKPHLLFSPKFTDDEALAQPPVLLWLLPKLMGLLTQSTLQSLHRPIQDLLSWFIEVLQQKSSTWREASAVARLYEACVQCILTELDVAIQPALGANHRFQLSLPSSGVISDFWSESQQFVALPHNLQRTIPSRLGAIFVGFNLLHALILVLKQPSKNQIGPVDCAQHLPWVTDSVLTLWKHYRRCKLNGDRRPLQDGIVTTYLQFVDAVLGQADHTFTSHTKVKHVMLGELGDLLRNSDLSPVVQSQLASTLIKLRVTWTPSSHSGSGEDGTRNATMDHSYLETFETSVNLACQQEEVFSKLQRDLQIATCLWTSPGLWSAQVEKVRTELISSDVADLSDGPDDIAFASATKIFKELNISDGESVRPAKRRKIVPKSTQDIHARAYNQLVLFLTGSAQDTPVLTMTGLSTIVQNRFFSLPEDSEQNEQEQCQIISALGKLACAASLSLQKTTNPGQHICTSCDVPATADTLQPGLWDETIRRDEWKEVMAAMLVIIKEPKFQASPKARVNMAIAIGRVYNHISGVDYLNLEICDLGQWLLGSMSRSLRELKLAAMRSVMVFLRDGINANVRQKNRRFAIEFLDALGNRDNISDHETLIMAYGSVARVCGELELPIVLHHLIEYLGHSNALICGMAYRELDTLASDLGLNTIQLLQPHWNVIAFSVIKDIISKPQKAQLLADLTEQSVRQLLILTESDTLPHLVLTKRKDVIEKIAQARKASVGEVLTQPRRNLAKILALLLCQPVQDVESSAMASLAAIEPAIREGTGNKLDALIAVDITGVAIEILSLAATQDESKKKLFHRGFVTLAMLADSKSSQRKSVSKSKSLDSFCEVHILGIIAYFTNVIESPMAQGKAATQPLPERRRCIAAIGELISLARYSVNGALPQIRACLQSAMADEELCDDTFVVWVAFLNVLDVSEIMLLVDQTFAMIVQHWSVFSSETQLKANRTILNLTQKYEPQIRERIEYLPSLAGIPMLAKTEAELVRFKAMVDRGKVFISFSNRCKDQNAVVVHRALIELVPFLDANQDLMHQSINAQKPMPVLETLTRSILDASVRFAEDHQYITVLCAQCLGIIGGLDPYRVETVRERKRVLMLSNFSRRDEDIDFVAMLLEQVLVKVFLSTTNAKAQGWIAYVMQEMLKHCGFSGLSQAKHRSSQGSTEAQRWNEIPESVRNVLTPFLTSRYSVNLNPSLRYDPPECPIYRSGSSHGVWLQTFVYDLLRKGQGVNVEMVFPVLARIIRGYDLSIATFILPFAALNVIVSDDEVNISNVGSELITVLETKIESPDQADALSIKQCSENVFQVLDYLSLWLQEKRKAVAETRAMATKTGRGVSEDEEMNSIKQISRVEGILQMVPAEVISRRAVECGSYARALFHWEQYYRQQQQVKGKGKEWFLGKDDMLEHLQMIYAQIDEPDSIEGISAHLKVLNPEQQIIEDRKAGRWTAAQSWYEIALAEKPQDTDTQINLLTCLKESGQHDSILNYVDGFNAVGSLSSGALPFAAEAAWSANKWNHLERLLSASQGSKPTTFMDFNVGIGQAFLALRKGEHAEFDRLIQSLRESLATTLSPSTTTSIQACHEHLVKLHALYEIEALSGAASVRATARDVILENLDRRLEVIGAYTSDKQYLLGIRRAAMSMSRSIDFTNLDIASAWLTTARLARKGGFISTAFNSVMHAERLGDTSSKIEYSKLLWVEGHHRKAIQTLRGAIESNAFSLGDVVNVNVSVTTTGQPDEQTNKIKCRAQLLLAKWLDQAGQTKSGALKEEYVAGVMSYPRWDKGHYYLGRYYLKLLESEKRQPITKQSSEYLTGSLLKLVIENFVRSTVYGTKYYYQTLPKILTLWLDLGTEVMNTNARTTRDKEFHDHRANFLDYINKYLKRYAGERMPAYTWYTAFPQIITRISHPNKSVWDALQTIIVRVASIYPQQSLWSLLAVLHSTQEERRSRGTQVLQKLREASKRKGSSLDLKNLIIQGQRLTDALLAACDAPVEGRVSHISLSKDLGFNHKLAPCQLVVPIENNLLPNLPVGNDSKTIRSHNPFPSDTITIDSFMDDVLVLTSLQRPRKLNVRGSDGRSYGLLCKPKDDLRKDQRLMEFNAMINRALQKDIGSSKRRLYIKTYAVTPLNEECGAIEWVEGLKPMRDIIIRAYRQHNIAIDYTDIRLLLNEASSSPSKVPIFTEKILGKFPAVLHEWFVETFPEPEAWFTARLRYTRSCAVMSIVGHVLGLGDRHGENVLLEQGDGGTFHVDFNCLFDKGLTFEKPELVPFRLTHNMVDAMGPQGIEGPFRKAAELTYMLLRQHEDTLITILETFVHDPTADFLGGKKRKKINGVPDTPQEVLDMVRTKVNGYLKGESVPLSVEGYVDALIAMAKDPVNLAAMYIGWCAFF